MIISFDVNNQIISRTDENRVVSKSVNYLIAKFSFSEDWNKNSLITPLFISSDKKAYTPELRTDGRYIDEEGCCFVPHEALEAEGILLVSVTEYDGDLKKRITANTAVVHVEESGETTAQTSLAPEPSVYEKLISDYKEIKENALMKNNVDLKLTDRILQLTANGEAVGEGTVLPKAPVVNMIDIQSNIIVEEEGLVFGGNISIILPDSKIVGFGILGGRINSDGSFLPGELYPLLPPYATDGFNGATQIKIAFSVVFEGMKIVFDEALLKQLISNDITAEFIQGVYKSHLGDTEKKQYLFFGIKSDNRDFLNEITTEFSQFLSMGNQMCVSFISFGGESNEQ